MTWIRNRPTGLVYRDESLAHDGYALVPQGEQVVLIDAASGEVAHAWEAPAAFSYARLLPDGVLMGLLGGDPMQPPKIANGEIYGIAELDAEGRVVWKYDGDLLHHDVWRDEDGSYLALGYDLLSKEQSAAIRGGAPHDDDPEQIWGDSIERIGRDGGRETVWRAVDHLDPEVHVLCPLDNRKEWTHANSIRAKRDGSLLLSLRLSSYVIAIDRETGSVAWSWGGAGLTSHQHDARELDDGHILIFDNGVHRERAPGFARVLEVDPASDEIVWQYMDKTILAFQTFMAGGAQRLANRNTFITEAATGRLFQVTPEGETVWEWVNPRMAPSIFGPTPVVFRSHWYSRGDPRLPAKLR